MNNYKKFYLKTFVIIFLYTNIVFIGFFSLYFYLTLRDNPFYSFELSNILIQFQILCGILTGCGGGIVAYYYYSRAFRLLQEKEGDKKWKMVDRINFQLKLSIDQVYDRSISCISSIKWHILEEKRGFEDNPLDFRILGVTNYGIHLYPDIFIIDISELGDGFSRVDCSVRTVFSNEPYGGKRCGKRRKRLTDCLSPQKFNYQIPYSP